MEPWKEGIRERKASQAVRRPREVRGGGAGGEGGGCHGQGHCEVVEAGAGVAGARATLLDLELASLWRRWGCNAEDMEDMRKKAVWGRTVEADDVGGSWFSWSGRYGRKCARVCTLAPVVSILYLYRSS